MAVCTLPDPPYDYVILEPYISGTIMKLHHDRHRANYVGSTNATLEKLETTRESGDFVAISLCEGNLAFSLGDHTNHTIFWQSMTPGAQERPEGKLAAAIDEYFGSFEKFQDQFAAVVLELQGSGWGVLVWDALPKRLVTLQLIDQQGNTPVATVPLFMLDMWERTFYLDYQNVKADYVKAWWNVVSWVGVTARFEHTCTQYTGPVLVRFLSG